MQDYVTHYQILGIKPNQILDIKFEEQNQKIIKEAYQNLLLIWHPDKAENWVPKDKIEEVNEVFRRIQSAYITLKDPESRNQYSLFLQSLSKIPLGVDAAKVEKAFYQSYNALKAQYDAYQKRFNDPNEYANYLNQQTNDLYQQLEQAQTCIEKLTKDIQRLPQVVKNDEKKLSKLQAQLQQKEKIIAEIHQANVNLNTHLRTLQTQVHEQEKLITTLQTEKAQLMAENAELKKRPGFFAQSNAMQQSKKVKTDAVAAAVKDIKLATDKIVPQGLKKIHKILLDNMGKEDEFLDVLLEFDNEEAAKNFVKAFHGGEKKSINFHYLYAQATWQKNRVMRQTVPFSTSFSMLFNDRNQKHVGGLLLKELEKYVDITEIPQEFRTYYGEEIKSEGLPLDLPFEFK